MQIRDVRECASLRDNKDGINDALCIFFVIGIILVPEEFT